MGIGRVAIGLVAVSLGLLLRVRLRRAALPV
jgi:hypothetical protein